METIKKREFKMNRNIITIEGRDAIKELLDKLREENKHWTEEKRIAALQGDLSENSEYISAKENIRNTDRVIHKLENILDKNTAVDTKNRVFRNMVLFGSEVKLIRKTKDTEEELNVRIVGTNELIYLQKTTDTTLISNISDVGRYLIRKEPGDKIRVKEFVYEIVDILN